MKNIVITGASKGIGFELCKLFLKRNNRVLAISRTTGNLDTITNPNLNVIPADISKEEDLMKIERFVKANWDCVDILINNAGKLINKPFEELTTSDFTTIYQVNVFGVAALTKLLLNFLNKGSHVLNISSIGGIPGTVKFPGLAAYSSSKGALNILTELLAEEYKPREIAFNTLALGAVQTEMLEAAFPGYKAPLNADEMATYICDFALNGAKYFNGKTIPVSSSTP